MLQDHTLEQLLSVPQDETQRAIAARYAPRIRFDANEPFLPLAAGYTIFRDDGDSPSFSQGKRIALSPPEGPVASLAIEYAIWWDWDIGHLYELEHIWVFVDAAGNVIRGQASWHGDLHSMADQGKLEVEQDHLVVYSEPGKHAFAPTPEWFHERWQQSKRSPTEALAGISGVLVASYFEGQILKTPQNDRLVHSYLAQKAFAPSWEFDQVFDFAPVSLVPWPTLKDWIPTRVNEWLDRLAKEISPSQYRFLRVGHRGARAHAPDNTLASFRQAASLGADLVELDVQRTADNQMAVVHDAWLQDSEGHILPVRQSTLAQLQAIDLGQGEHIPTLTEVLDLCEQEQMGAYIEIKDGGVVPALVQSLLDRGGLGSCLIGSFRPDWIADVKALAPQATTSILFSSPSIDAVQLARAVGATYVHPCWERFDRPSAKLTPEWLTRVRQANLGIVIWHEERPNEIAALRQLGVDAICSDAPELLLD